LVAFAREDLRSPGRGFFQRGDGAADDHGTIIVCGNKCCQARGWAAVPAGRKGVAFCGPRGGTDVPKIDPMIITMPPDINKPFDLMHADESIRSVIA
jgi:hypothetical protein